jgi:prepilin-type N-terminal cleavage/methylation domain-containing protein
MRQRASCRRDRNGLTMFEIVIALALAGIVLTGGALLLDELGDANARVFSASSAEAKTNNGARTLERFFADARPAADSSERFAGDSRTAIYATLCDTPSGWRERCRVKLMIDSLADSSAIIALSDRGDALTLGRVAGAATFRYVDLSARDTTWFVRWSASVALPHAMAIVAGADTTVMPVGSARE